MAQLIVRNIDIKVVAALKRRAAARGVSVEAEHRLLLEAALLGSGRPSFKKHACAEGDSLSESSSEGQVVIFSLSPFAR